MDKQFRCYTCNALFGKLSACSIIEVKCHKCGNMHSYIQGTSFFHNLDGGLINYKKTKKEANKV